VTTIRVDPLAPDEEAIVRAADLLRGGGLVALPTETVYGLGANALDPAAVRRVFEAKGRPGYNPLIVHVSDPAAARQLAASWPETADRLAERFWPGPLTIVLPKQALIPDIVTAGLATVGLRVPSHPVMLAVLRRAHIPIAAPSANQSGGLSPTSAQHVERSLGNRVPLILDAGPTTVGLESTVIDLSGPMPVLLRPGAISRSELEALIGTVELPGASGDPYGPRPSPGMLDRHYAPRGRLRLISSANRDEIPGILAEAHATGLIVGALLRTIALPTVRHAVRLADDPAEFGRDLFAVLHDLDDEGCGLILAELPPDTPEWAAVRDRLVRAAGE
jgi:L-threonylcarbamoyladenylate synthase